MPPGQPVHRCTACGLLRPCKPFNGAWTCYDCHPNVVDTDQDTDEYDEVTGTAVDDELEPPEKPVATDGGDDS